MRRLLLGLAFAVTAACSFVFELPESPLVPADAALLEDAPAIDVPPPPRFCQADAGLYCVDFDDEPPIDVAAIGPLAVSDGTLVLSSAVAHSPQRSLLARTFGADASAAVTRALATDALTLSFRQLVSAWETTNAELARIELGSCSVGLVGTATTWAVKQSCAPADDVTTATTLPIVRGRWQHFVLSVAFAPTPTVVLLVDDVRAVDVASILTRGPASIGLGIAHAPSGSATLFHDDVLVTTP